MTDPGQIAQTSAGLQGIASSTTDAVESVRSARKEMSSFIMEFEGRSSGSFAAAVGSASLRIDELYVKIEERLTKYAGDSRAMDTDIQATNAAQKSKVDGVAQ